MTEAPNPDFRSIELRSARGATAALYPYGAHVVSWRAANGRECLFTSANAVLQAGAAIRGGVPIIFPQFAALGPLPRHGLARTAIWQPVSVAPDEALLRWQDDQDTYALWPAHFLAEYRVALSDDALTMTLSITNTGAAAWSFTAALHTYLRVQDISQVAIAGLRGCRYSDSAAAGAMGEVTESTVSVSGEFDRIYFATDKPIAVSEAGSKLIECHASGFADTVVWNPGAAKSAALTDLEPEGYRRMLCVEAAAIARPVVLAPDATWIGTQELRDCR